MNTLICLLAVGVGNPAAVPLHCPTPNAPKGDVKGGPPLAHTFELTHRGAAGVLTITKVEAGCGCLRQTLTAGILQPGETSKLTIEVNTLTQPDGPNRWQIAVGYRVDTPGMPQQTGEILLQITATLTRELSVSPAQVAFSSTGSASQLVTITDRRAKPLTILKAGSSAAHLTTEIGQPQAAPGGGRVQTITLKLAADAPTGHRDEAVVLLTDDPAYPELRIPVRILKRGAITASPETVAVRFAPGQTEVSTLVQLRTADGKAIGVASAESDHPGVTVKWSPGSGPVAAVRVTVSDIAASQAGTGTVRVKLTEPAGQELVVPVAWTVAKKDR